MTISPDKTETSTPRTDAKAGFANFDDAMKGGPGNVVPADFARELERELADALSGTDSLTWQYWRDRARAAESNTPSANTETHGVNMPPDLHPTTKHLVLRFAQALAEKLYDAEQKYGYDDGWSGSAWESECREKLYEHLAKGDPRDVANYCAFMWHHRWSTKRPLPSSVEDRERWFVAREHAITIPGEARPSIGYIVVPKWPTFASFDEAAIFIKERDLPIGWVALRESQLAKRVPSATQERKP